MFIIINSCRRASSHPFASTKWNSYKDIVLNKWEYETAFMRSSGPGGQSVNKTNSKAQLRLKINECSLVDKNMLTNLRSKYSNNITNENQFIVRSQKFTSQGQNLDECFERMKRILFQCSAVKEERKSQPYVQTQDNRQKRLNSKKKKSEIKSMRQNKYFD